MNSGDVSAKADEVGRRADDSDLLDHAGRLIWRGLSEGFKKHLETAGRTGTTGTAFVMFGKVGYGLFCFVWARHLDR